MNEKRSFPVLVIVFALILSACGGGVQTQPVTSPEEPGKPAATQPPPPPGTPVVLRIGWAGSPDTLNPGTAVLSEAYTIFALVYDTIYEYQLDGTYKLDVAESADVSDDGLTWTFKIREGIAFHDGQPMTANDVAFSINLYKNNGDYVYLNAYTANFDTVEATDDNTVVVTLTDPVPNMDYLLSYLYIVPEHIWKDYAEAPASTEFENEEMIGTGPFKMVEYRQNEFVHLAANKDHFENPPKIDEVVFQTFESQDVLVQSLKSGQVDMITEMPATAVETLKNDPNVQVVTGAPFAPTVSDIIFNQADPDKCPTDVGGLCTGHPALRDRNVRLALAHATDKQKLIDVVLLGFGSPGLTLIPDGLGHWYNDSLVDYEYDVAKANQILDDAGYLDTDGDGIRQMPDGSQPLNFRVHWPSDSIDAPRLAELLSEMWSQVGVETELQAVDPDALTAECCPAFDFDIILWGWGSDPDPNLLLAVHTTDEIPNGYNETGYSNPVMDDLYVQQGIELDTEKRREIVWEMQRIAFEDVVYVIPYYEQAIQAFRVDRFKGWILDQDKVELSDVSSLVVIEPVE
ncbi:MAG: ABC transporter substrate-binding protein [Anaerolineales bacterium]|nr:ABC transporter substrate-binding protein [Anaerolineales bacterium]NUQ85227.1 ABC transporter substrate-binding protein [Anaerolineales bacterium]